MHTKAAPRDQPVGAAPKALIRNSRTQILARVGDLIVPARTGSNIAQIYDALKSHGGAGISWPANNTKKLIDVGELADYLALLVIFGFRRAWRQDRSPHCERAQRRKQGVFRTHSH